MGDQGEEKTCWAYSVAHVILQVTGWKGTNKELEKEVEEFVKFISEIDVDTEGKPGENIREEGYWVKDAILIAEAFHHKYKIKFVEAENLNDAEKYLNHHKESLRKKRYVVADICGTTWDIIEDFFNTKPKKPKGSILGEDYVREYKEKKSTEWDGHAVVLIGKHSHRKMEDGVKKPNCLEFKNSHGPTFGDNGKFRISQDVVLDFIRSGKMDLYKIEKAEEEDKAEPEAEHEAEHEEVVI